MATSVCNYANGWQSFIDVTLSEVLITFSSLLQTKLRETRKTGISTFEETWEYAYGENIYCKKTVSSISTMSLYYINVGKIVFEKSNSAAAMSLLPSVTVGTYLSNSQTKQQVAGSIFISLLRVWNIQLEIERMCTLLASEARVFVSVFSCINNEYERRANSFSCDFYIIREIVAEWNTELEDKNSNSRGTYVCKFGNCHFLVVSGITDIANSGSLPYGITSSKLGSLTASTSRVAPYGPDSRSDGDNIGDNSINSGQPLGYGSAGSNLGLSNSGICNAAGRKCKLVLLGEASVGKSSIVRRFVRGEFSEGSETTVGAAFFTKSVDVDGRRVRFEIWDTAGQERFAALAPMYYRGAACAVVTYDQTSVRSFERAKVWVEQLQLSAAADIVVALAANKSDLPTRGGVCSRAARRYADENGLIFLETSAKTGHNIGLLFTSIARHLPPTSSNSPAAGDMSASASVGSGYSSTVTSPQVIRITSRLPPTSQKSCCRSS